MLVVLAIFAGQVADAQEVRQTDRTGSTGRTPSRERDRGLEARKPFSIFFSAGVQASGDLFKVTADRLYPFWRTSTGETFAAERFTAGLDEDLQIALGCALRSGSLAWRLGYEYAETGVFAMARQGDTGLAVPFDKIEFSTVGFDILLELADASAIPYLLGGAAVTLIDGGYDFFDQTRLGWRYGAGFSYAFTRNARAAFEIVDTRIQVESRDFMDTGTDASAEHTRLGPQHLFGIRCLVSVEL